MPKRKLIKQILSMLRMNGTNAHNLGIAYRHVFLKIAPVLHWSGVRNYHIYSDYADRSLGTWHRQIVEVECHEGDCND